SPFGGGVEALDLGEAREKGAKLIGARRPEGVAGGGGLGPLDAVERQRGRIGWHRLARGRLPGRLVAAARIAPGTIGPEVVPRAPGAVEREGGAVALGQVT